MTSDRTRLALELMALMTFATCVLAICVAVVAKTAFARVEKGAASTFTRLVQRSGGLELLTVQTIVMSVLVLAIVGVVDGAASVSVLSGIAGYVLGKGARTEQLSNADITSQQEDEPKPRHYQALARWVAKEAVVHPLTC